MDGDEERIILSSAAESPEDARTLSSAASSMRRRIEVTLRKTPGSMGGGVGFPGSGTGNRGGKFPEDVGVENAIEAEREGARGESGGERSGNVWLWGWIPLRLLLGKEEPVETEGGSRGERGSGAAKVAGSRLSVRSDSKSSSGSWSHGP
jgi:hypothetical protein